MGIGDEERGYIWIGDWSVVEVIAKSSLKIIVSIDDTCSTCEPEMLPGFCLYLTGFLC